MGNNASKAQAKRQEDKGPDLRTSEPSEKVVLLREQAERLVSNIVAEHQESSEKEKGDSDIEREGQHIKLTLLKRKALNKIPTGKFQIASYLHIYLYFWFLQKCNRCFQAS